MTIYRLVELHCDGDGGDCPAQPDMTRGYESAALLWKRAKSLGWVRRRCSLLPARSSVAWACSVLSGIVVDGWRRQR